jgi:hypothetical protein
MLVDILSPSVVEIETQCARRSSQSKAIETWCRRKDPLSPQIGLERAQRVHGVVPLPLPLHATAAESRTSVAHPVEYIKATQFCSNPSL